MARTSCADRQSPPGSPFVLSGRESPRRSAGGPSIPSWPLLRIASPPAAPLPRSRRGRVSQPRPRPTSRCGRFASPAVWTARPNDGTALNRLVPQPTSMTRRVRVRVRVRDGWPARPPNERRRRNVLKLRTQTGRQGPAPPSAWRGADTTEDDRRLLSPVCSSTSFILHPSPVVVSSPPVPGCACAVAVPSVRCLVPDTHTPSRLSLM